MHNPKTVQYPANQKYVSHDTHRAVNAPAKIKAMLLIRSTSAHGRSAISPVITLPAVLEIPIIEMSKSACIISMPTSFPFWLIYTSGTKYPKMKQSE